MRLAAALCLLLVAGCLETDNVKVERVARSGHDSEQSCDCDGPYLNVKSSRFGAIGDGAHDDTAAIQAAIDSLVVEQRLGVDAANAAGGTVYFPPGKYRVTTSVVLDSARGHQNVTLLGAGPNASVIAAADDDGEAVLVARGAPGDSVNGFAVRDLTIAGNPR